MLFTLFFNMTRPRKTCFVLQRRFAYIGHAMARHLKTFDPKMEFCALIGQRSSLRFLEAQRDIAYTSLLLEEDVHKKLYSEELDMKYLRWLENEYGIPNLWPYLYIDRVIMNGQLVREYPFDAPSLSHEDMLRRLQVTAKAVIAFLDKEQPDAVVISVIGSVGSMLLHHIAKKRGIQTIQIEFARIGNRIVFSENYHTFTWVREKFEKIRSGQLSPMHEEAKRFLAEFRATPVHYDESAVPEFYKQTGRLANIRFLQPRNLARSVPWHIRTLLQDFKRRKDPDYTDIFLWWALWDKVKRKIRGLRGAGDLFSPADMKKQFAYFPLHIDPEVATMLYAPFYTNQLELIRAIARSLPIDMPLYVKEHPGMVGYRTRVYYRELTQIPNVRLMSPSVSGLDLAAHSSLTITITSTNAWESVLLKKPVITFGDVFFNDIPGVERCQSIENLPFIVKRQLEEWRHDEETLIAYMSALLEDSVAVDFSALWNKGASSEEVHADSGIRNLARLLADKILHTSHT